MIINDKEIANEKTSESKSGLKLFDDESDKVTLKGQNKTINKGVKESNTSVERTDNYNKSNNSAYNIEKLEEDDTELCYKYRNLTNENANLKKEEKNLRNICEKLQNDNIRLYDNCVYLTNENANLKTENENLCNICEKLQNDNINFKRNIDQLTEKNIKLLDKMADLNVDNGKTYSSVEKFPITQISVEFTKIRNEWDIFIYENSNKTSRELEIESEKFFGETAIRLLQTFKQNSTNVTEEVDGNKKKVNKSYSFNLFNKIHKQSNDNLSLNEFSKEHLDEDVIIEEIELSILDTKYLFCTQKTIKNEIDKIREQVKILLNKCQKNNIEIEFIAPIPGDLFNEDEHEALGSLSYIKNDVRKIKFCKFPGVISITSRQITGEKNVTCQVRALVYI